MNLKKKQKTRKTTQATKRDTRKKKVRKNKFKRIHKGRTPLISYSLTSGKLIFGAYGIIIIKPTWFNDKKIEAGRKYIRKYLKKKNKLWIRIFPDLPVTKKPTGVRMGKGKGKPNLWVSKLPAGTMLFELDNITRDKANKIARVLKKAWSFSFQIINMDIY